MMEKHHGLVGEQFSKQDKAVTVATISFYKNMSTTAQRARLMDRTISRVAKVAIVMEVEALICRYLGSHFPAKKIPNSIKRKASGGYRIGFTSTIDRVQVQANALNLGRILPCEHRMHVWKEKQIYEKAAEMNGRKKKWSGFACH